MLSGAGKQERLCEVSILASEWVTTRVAEFQCCASLTQTHLSGIPTSLTFNVITTNGTSGCLSFTRPAFFRTLLSPTD